MHFVSKDNTLTLGSSYEAKTYKFATANIDHYRKMYNNG